MNCPHCHKPIDSKQSAKILRSYCKGKANARSKESCRKAAFARWQKKFQISFGPTDTLSADRSRRWDVKDMTGTCSVYLDNNGLFSCNHPKCINLWQKTLCRHILAIKNGETL